MNEQELLSKTPKKVKRNANTIKYGIIEFLNEYNDFKLDYPKLDQTIILIFNNLYKINLLTLIT